MANDKRFVAKNGLQTQNTRYLSANGSQASLVSIDNNGNLTVDAGTSSNFGVIATNAGVAELGAYGAPGQSQTTGVVYAGQSPDHGGGIFYNGDGTPSYATGEGSDEVTLFRRTAGVNHAVMKYSHSSNNVTFTGIINGNGSGLTNVTADSWTTARTISLTGAVTGSTSIDGSGNVSISTTATSDPTLTLSGDASGSATFTNLGNATLTVSNVNANTLDSLNSTQFVRSDTSDTMSGSYTVTGNMTVNGTLDVYGNFINFISGTDARIEVSDANPPGAGSEFIFWGDGLTNNAKLIASVMEANTFIGDGSSVTNVNAQTLDSINSTQFLRSDVSDTSTGDITIQKDNPWLTLDSSSSGANGGEQGAGISIGESGYKGSAVLHLTYTGDGRGHIGMGSVDASGIPANSAMRLYYQDNNVDFLGNISVTGTVSGNGSGLTSVNAATLDSIDSTGFLRSNTDDTGVANYNFNGSESLAVRRGLDGGYGNTTASSSNWGANIWSIGRSWNGTGSGDTFTLGTGQYGLVWLRDSHPGAMSSIVDEGLYLYRAGNRFAAFGHNGTRFDTNVRATGDVTAFYSDERLKDFHGTIDSALDKVTSLSGYYYTGNEVAKSLGYDNEQRQLGVSAQEVQKVFPEVVARAPISDTDEVDEEYLTVKYEKLVPALIEAIKEQQQQIDDLKEQVNKLLGSK